MNQYLYIIIYYNVCFPIVTAADDTFDSDLSDVRPVRNWFIGRCQFI